MKKGWVGIHRKILENDFCKNNSQRLGFWVTLLLLANHDENSFIFGSSKVTCKRGEFITGRRKLSLICGVSEMKAERWLSCLENEHQIEQQKTTKYRLIIIKNWDTYRMDEQHNARQMNNKRTTNEQQMNTNNNVKNVENDNNNINNRYAPERARPSRKSRNHQKGVGGLGSDINYLELLDDQIGNSETIVPEKFDSEYYIKKIMSQDENMHVRLIGWFFEQTNAMFDCKEDVAKSIARHSRAAIDLMTRDERKVSAVAEYLKSEEKWLRKWTLETILKYIDQPDLYDKYL